MILQLPAWDSSARRVLEGTTLAFLPSRELLGHCAAQMGSLPGTFNAVSFRPLQSGRE